MDEQELQQNIRTLELYRAQLESLDQQYEYLAVTMREHHRALETMRGYRDLKEGSETLFPIGGNSFLFAKSHASGKALVGIGVDMVVETDMEDAIHKFEERIKDIEDAMKGLNEKYQDVARKATAISSKIQEAYQAR